MMTNDTTTRRYIVDAFNHLLGRDPRMTLEFDAEDEVWTAHHNGRTFTHDVQSDDDEWTFRHVDAHAFGITLTFPFKGE